MNERHKQPVIFGEVLFDCFEDGSRVLGGAPFNVAWHLQAFGLQPLFISRVGNDDMGQQIMTAMQEVGMSCEGMQTDAEHMTGSVEVSIRNGEPEYDIVTDRAYDFISHELLPDVSEGSILYHGSLALRNATSLKALQTLLDRTHLPRFIDVNLRNPWWQKAVIIDLVRQAEHVKLNEHELMLLHDDQGSLENTLSRFQESLEIKNIILTRGSDGALHRSIKGQQAQVKPEYNTNVVDTVGAGDAFASVLMLGTIRQWPVEQTLQRAQRFASAIVGIRGATTKDQHFYHRFIADWELS